MVALLQLEPLDWMVPPQHSPKQLEPLDWMVQPQHSPYEVRLPLSGMSAAAIGTTRGHVVFLGIGFGLGC